MPMKKNLFSSLFQVVNPRFEKDENGIVSETEAPPNRLAFPSEAHKPSRKTPLVISTLLVTFAGTSLVLGALNQTLERRNRDLKSQVEKTNKMIEETQAEKTKLEGSIDQLKSEITSLKERVKKSEASLRSSSDEKVYLEDILIHKTKEIENLKQTRGTSPALQPAGSGVPAVFSGDASEALKQKESEIKRLYEQNAILSKKLSKLYKTTSEKISEIQVAKITLEDTIAGARQTIDSEFNTVDLGTISANPNSAPKPQSPRVPKKDGKVLAVNEEHGFVVVDLGKIDGIKTDSEIILNQGGQTVATLKVLELRDEMTACNILEITPGKKIQLNDPVLIRK